MTPEDKIEIKKFTRIVKYVVVWPCVCLTTFVLANMLSGHRLQAYVTHGLVFREISMLGESPNGEWNVQVMHSGLQGASYDVRISKRYYICPRSIMHFATEDFSNHGPLENRLAVAWSASGERCALVWEGWYVDCYDVKKQLGQRFSNCLSADTNLEKLKTYHDRTTQFLGDKPTAIAATFDKSNPNP